MKKIIISFFVLGVLAAFSTSALAQIPSSGLRLHLKADAGTSTTVSGQKVSSWADQSGNGYQAVETNPTWQPTYIVENGISMLRFNSGAPTSMDLPTHSELGIQNSEYEFFLVTKTSSQSGAQFAFAGGINYNEIQISDANGVRFITQFGNSLDNPARVDNGEFHVINSIAKTTGSELGIDGVYVSKSGDATHSVDAAFHLGTRANGLYRLDGDIAEVIVYNRKLTSTESMQVSEYLKDKYSTDFTAYAAPGTPAGNLSFSSVTPYGMNLNLTKGSGSHRLIIARKGSAVNSAPTIGVSYSGNLGFGLGDEIGTGNYVMYAGTAGTSNSITNLIFDETYHFAVYEYNLVNGFTNYSVVSTTSQATPNLTQSSNLQISGRTGSSFSGALTPGNGSKRLIVARQGGAVNWGPTDGVDYFGNTSFGSGSEIGTGNYVIYDGDDGSSFTLTSLAASTAYHLAVFEFSYENGVPKYRDSNPPTASDITFPVTQASNVQFTGTGLNEMTVSFTPGNGNKRIVIARSGTAVSATPVNGQSYTASSVFGSGTNMGSENYVIYNGTGSSVALTGLDNSTTYYFAVYEYSEYNGVTSHLTSSPATGSNSTTIVPLPVVSGATFGSGTSTSREITGLVNPNGYETTVEIIYGTDAGNLNGTTASHSIGSGIVNVADTVDVTGLITGQTYYAKIRATNLKGSVESSLVTLVPLTLTSLQGWYRGDVADINSGNGKIIKWNDLSNSARDLTEGINTTIQSLSGINGKPVAVFNNSSFNFLPEDLGILNTDLEMFIVFKYPSNTKQYILEQESGVTVVELNVDGNGIFVNPLISTYSSGNANGITSGSLNEYSGEDAHILHYKTANNRHQLRMDNGEFTYKSGNNRINTNYKIEIAGQPNNTTSNGQIAEILFFNAELPFEQRREIAQYLTDRYAISMFVPSVPETASSSLNFTNVGATNFDVGFTKGDGERRIVVARLNGSTKTAPTSNTVYTANATFGSGSNLGNNNYVVYDGTGNSVAVTGLAANSEYTIDVYEYNNMELDPQYMLTSPNSSTQTTLGVTPPIVQLTGVLNLGATTADINSLINPNTDQTSIQIFYGTGPSALNSSTVAQPVGNQSTVQAVSTSLTGLSAGTQYYYKVSATNLGGTTDSEIGSFVFNENVNLSSLQYWLAGDGATFTNSSGDAVSVWGNQSGKFLNATQTATASQPQLITDSGISFVKFDGSNDYLNLPRADSLGINDSNYEMFIVARSAVQNVAFLLAGDAEEYEIHLQTGASTAGSRFIPKSSTYIDNAVNTTDGAFHILNVKATDSEGALRVDGNTVSSGINTRSASVASLVLGSRKGGGLPLNGDIAEVIIYNSDLTDVQRIRVEQYLAEKYSVELPYYHVNSTSDTNTGTGRSGTLRYVLNAINTEAPNSYVHVDMSTINGTIRLNNDLPPINYNITIIGSGKENLTINGNNFHRPFFIGAGTPPFSSGNPASPIVTLKNFTIAFGLGKGGNGNAGSGGAAGMGGAIFINKGDVFIENMKFNLNRAIGGDGSAGGGGGGGGGFGSNSNGFSPGSSGLIGGLVPTSTGQSGGDGAGGYGGDTEVAANGGFGGGGASSAFKGLLDKTFGGTGGFGGGGGGPGFGRTTNGGGGFGAGTGVFYSNTIAAYAVGGGAAGLGGAIFNRFGKLFIVNSDFTANSALGGARGRAEVSNAGSSYGGAVFNYEGEILESGVTYGTGGNANSSDFQPDFYNYTVVNSELRLAEILKATNITSSSVSINGNINTFGFSGTYHIAYGTDLTNLSSTTSNTNYNGENSEVTISVPLSGLSLNNMHYFKIVLVNELGTFESEVNNVVYDTSIPSDSLKLWVSAERGLEISESKIVKWFDASNNSNSVNQSISSNQPVTVDNVVNGKPVVRFNGSSSFMTLPGAGDLGIQNSDYELFVVAKSSSNSVQFLYSGGAEAHELQLNGTPGIRSIPKSGTYIDGGTPNEYTSGKAHIINSQITSSNGEIRINDELVGQVLTNSHNASDASITLGRRYEGSFLFNGDIAEMIIYNKALSNADRETVVNYLANKYDIEPYVSSTPTVNATQALIREVSTGTINAQINKGNGAKRLILAKQGSAVDAQPVNNQVYTSNLAFGSGDEIGTGNFAVYNGSDSVFTVTGLSAGVKYYFTVFEYNGTIETLYLNNSVLTFSETTLSALPAGLSGSSITFGGNDEKIMMSHGPEFNSTAVTMELWFKSDDSGTDVDFLTSKASEELEIHLGADGVANTIRFIPASQVYIDSPVGAFTAGEWTHLAVVYDPANASAKMYVNGAEVTVTNNGTNPLTTPRKQTTSSFYLGSRAGSALHFNGSMDEVRIWNSVRTEDEIRAFMHRTIETGFQDLIAYWQFNEGSGTTLADKVSGLDGTLQDFEFNANNGWVDSDIAFGSGVFTAFNSITSGSHIADDLIIALTDDFENSIDLSVTHMTTAPNVTPSGVTKLLADEYWVVQSHGTAGAFSSTLTFTVPVSLTSGGQINTEQFKLYRRGVTSTGSWVEVSSSAASASSTTISFDGISEFGQFTIGRVFEVNYDQFSGNALKFDGVNDYIAVAHNDVFNVEKYTMELWFKWNNSGAAVEFLTGKAGSQFEIHLGGTSNAIRYIPHSGMFVDSPAEAIIPGEWTHLAVMYDPGTSTAKMYINGVDINVTKSSTNFATLVSSSAEFNIGRRQVNRTLYFTGEMDEIRIWKTIRTPQQVVDGMNETIPSGFDPDLIGYWQLNEGTGTSTAEKSTGLVGTLSGFDQTTTSGWKASGIPISETVSTQLTGSQGWRLLASPVSDTSISPMLSNIWTQGFTGANINHGSPNVFIWSIENGTNASSNWTPFSDIANSPQNGSAALVYVFSDDNGPDVEGDSGFPKTVGVEGIEPTSDRDLTSLLNTNVNGWTLLGNPYKKDVDWDEFTKTNLSEAVYVYDANAASWKEWSSGVGDLTNGEIGAFNGFFVQTTGENPTLTVPRSAKLDSTTKFLGKQSESKEVFFLSLSLKNEHGLSDQSWFRLSEDGNIGLDNKDAHTLIPLGYSYVLIGSVLDDGTLLSINSLPLNERMYEFPLDLGSTESGEHTISVDQFALPDGWEVQLKDNQTGSISTLEEPYSFTMEATVAFKNKSLSKAPKIQKVEKSNGSSRFVISISSIGFDEASQLPEVFDLKQNYPNPFNPSTVIRYQLPENSKVVLQVFDILGREVAELVNEQVQAGYHKVTFDAGNLASGMYLYRLQAGNTVITKKLMLIK